MSKSEWLQSAADVQPARPIQHLHQVELARRWRVSERTLERWRWLRIGPNYLKVGGRVIYRIEDIEAYEQANLRQLPSKSDRGGRS